MKEKKHLRLGLMVLATGVAALPPAALADDEAEQHDAEIIVSAPVSRELGSALSGISVVSGEELVRSLQPTIGETLAHSAGVSSTSFGPNASRPILRGFQGERVRVLTDGIGSFDVSNTSVDHAVAINPLTADRIEVLRGPSALLYGSSAIGGVVNVIDSRIPVRLPAGDVHVTGSATYGSAAQERSLAGAADAPLGGGFVLHADASYQKTGDLETGGYLLSPALRAQALAASDPAIQALADLKGKLPNSAGRSWDVAGALAYLGAGVDGGLSIARHESLYGVPVRYSLDPDAPAEEVRLDAGQTRVDGRFNVGLGNGLFEKLSLRAGYADYRHAEIDETGAVGTRFFTKGGEARLELMQRERGGWSGAVGLQGLVRTLNVVGEEKFLPKSRTEQFGLFMLQEWKLGTSTVEAGARYEHSHHQADADALLGNSELSRSFDAVSFSLGSGHEVAPGWRIGLNGSRSARAPSAEELFANGLHAGTQTYEFGDPDLRVERAWGLEATVHGRGDGYALDAAIYRNWFSHYIYEDLTGYDSVDNLPQYQMTQADARYWGLEVEGSVRLAQIGLAALVADGLLDLVEADIVGVGPAPRIPPLRLLGGLEAQADRWTARAEVEHVTAQNRLAVNETRTAGYTLVNLSASVHPFREWEQLNLVVSANNLFDVTARRHASFLKDYAPLAGRDVRVTVKLGM